MKNQVIKILVADDHTLFRQGIIRLLEDHQDFSVVAEAENGIELIEKYFSICPDLILVDIAMPELSGIQAVQEILRRDRNAKALFLSMYDEGEYVYKVFKSGGMGLVNKNILEDELFMAIEKVSIGEKYFGKKWSYKDLTQLINEYEKILDKNHEFHIRLNFREEQILHLVIEGEMSKDIAEKLQMSKKTIDYYRSNLYNKFNTKTQAELISSGIKYFEIQKIKKNE